MTLVSVWERRQSVLEIVLARTVGPNQLCTFQVQRIGLRTIASLTSYHLDLICLIKPPWQSPEPDTAERTASMMSETTIDFFNFDPALAYFVTHFWMIVRNR